jgi:hypothetical protein
MHSGTRPGHQIITLTALVDQRTSRVLPSRSSESQETLLGESAYSVPSYTQVEVLTLHVNRLVYAHTVQKVDISVSMKVYL